MGYYYLACPYTGTEAEKAARVDLSLKVAAAYLKKGVHTFSPLVYVNQIADAARFNSLEDRRKVVVPFLFDFLKKSEGMIVIKAEGWAQSYGIQQELDFCQRHGIKVRELDFALEEQFLKRTS